MASTAGGKDSSFDSGQKEEQSTSKPEPKGAHDERRKFDIDSLIRNEYNRSPIDTCYRQNPKSSKSAQDHLRLGNHYDLKPTTSSKRHHDDDLSYPAMRISPLCEQNYFTTSANISKYNVLQVVQPTSLGTDCTDCSVTQQFEQKREQCGTIISGQSQGCLLNLRNEQIQDTHGNRSQFIPLSNPPNEAPIQSQLNANLETTAELTAFMPSLTALATYSMFNWCAKCNASFRMTSDLVHHMRTHHKKRKYNEDM